MRKHFEYSLEEKQEIAKFYEAGNSLLETGKQFGISGCQTKRLIKELVTIKPARRYVTLNHDFFETIDTEEKAYWLGFLTADGFLLTNKKVINYKICLKLQECDVEHIKLFLKTIGSDKTPYFTSTKDKRTNKTYTNYATSVSSEKMYKDLNNKGIYERKTWNCSPYIMENIDLQKHYWRGFIDGDGCLAIRSHINEKTKITSFSYRLSVVGTEQMCTGFKLFCDLFCPLTRNIYKEKDYYRFHLSGKVAIDMMNILYKDSTVYLDRKYKTYLNILSLQQPQLIE